MSRIGQLFPEPDPGFEKRERRWTIIKTCLIIAATVAALWVGYHFLLVPLLK